MNVKRMAFFLSLVLVLAVGSVFAHDKGDLMLNIEPQIGIAFPGIELKEKSIVKDKMAFGIDYALRGTVHYYFVDFFGVNAGLGISGFFDYFYADMRIGSGYYDAINFTFNSTFSALYFSIPLGFRFSLKAFAAGAGFTTNIPISGQSKIWLSGIGSGTKEKDDDFKLNPYMGWYIDIGFDLSGRKGRGGGFGMVGRLNGSFSNKIITHPDYDRFRHFSISVVFQPAIQLASLPIGG